MRILVTGATGFIGRHVSARLLARGHRVVAAVRDPAVAFRRFPGIEAFRVDMNRMVEAGDWRPLLEGIDAVVNCAGILQSKPGQSAAAIHAAAPKALFDACRAAGVRRVVQISAVSADAAAGTEYALSKKAADDHLRGLDLDWVVLRPSLVYAAGSYGGTSLIRGLAGFPLTTPLMGDGSQRFQPLHADDLAETVARGVEDSGLARKTLDPVGPETLSTREIVAMTRAWLDLAPAPMLPLPMGLMRVLARIGDKVDLGPLNSTALAQAEYGNTADADAFAAVIGFRPRRFAEALAATPSHVQDRWHARLYFLRPALTLSLVLLWLGSALAGAIATAQGTAPAPFGAGVSYLFCAADLVLAAAILRWPAHRLLGPVQLALVAAYTLGLTGMMPALWLDPFGGLLKNLPILAAIGAWTALQEER